MVFQKSVGRFVLKQDKTFLVAQAGSSLFEDKDSGLFYQGTRFLNSCELFLAEQPLMAISHSVHNNGRICQIDLCNGAPPNNQAAGLSQGSMRVNCQVELCDNNLKETFTITSYHFGVETVAVQPALKLAADFCDVFEIRDGARPQRGILQPARLTQTEMVLSYCGLDQVTRETRVTFSPAADFLTADGPGWQLQLSKGQPVVIQITTALNEHAAGLALPPISKESTYPPFRTVQTNNAVLDRLFNRGMHDYLMLCASTEHGLYPYGGIPWFSCPFGRDGLLASLEFLPWFPEITRGTLAFLAAHQGKKYDDFTEEAPGKILHELRYGEMINCRELPFAPYYGTIDATFLFLIVFEAYIRWSNDLTFLEQQWTQIEAAANWILNNGDPDRDTLIEYGQASEKGLGNQGWKDSGDAISHADGSLASVPIALCEIQGYAFAGYKATSYLASRLGKSADAAQWEQAAQKLQTKFLASFWWPEEQTFYLALDAAKAPCKVVSSNAGQCLWTGIVPDEYAGAIVERLMRSDMYSQWGIRTLSTTAVRYNPMGYHNGSVWPHDNALIGLGFARYGYQREASYLLHDLLEVSQHYTDARLPELFCGNQRQDGFGPTFYPVACLPQAWATGAPYLLLSSILGLQPSAEQNRLVLHNPTLPDWLTQVALRPLRLGTQDLHLRFERSARGIEVKQEGETEIEIHISH